MGYRTKVLLGVGFKVTRHDMEAIRTEGEGLENYDDMELIELYLEDDALEDLVVEYGGSGYLDEDEYAVLAKSTRVVLLEDDSYGVSVVPARRYRQRSVDQLMIAREALGLDSDTEISPLVISRHT